MFQEETTITDMGFFNWGKNEAPPAVRKPEQEQQPSEVKSETMPSKPIENSAPEQGVPSEPIETKSRDMGPVMVEPTEAVSEIPIEHRFIFDRDNKSNATEQGLHLDNAVVPKPDEAIEVEPIPEEFVSVQAEYEELQKLADTINKEHPGGMYLMELDAQGNFLKKSSYSWLIEKIYREEIVRPDGKKDTVHKVVLHPLGNPDVTEEYNLADFYKHLVKKPIS